MVVRSITLSFPEELVEEIDKERDDVTRSKFILRIVERHYNIDKKKGGRS